MEDDEDDEFALIAEMIIAAQKANMLVEVVSSFGSERAGGADVRDACAAALWDWDI